MEIVRDGPPVPNPYVRLEDIGFGYTFRMPKTAHACTVWMVTHNKSENPQRKKQIRCVSLRAGSVSYKDAAMDVVPVRGRFVVDDWGEG